MVLPWKKKIHFAIRKVETRLYIKRCLAKVAEFLCQRKLGSRKIQQILSVLPCIFLALGFGFIFEWASFRLLPDDKNNITYISLYHEWIKRMDRKISMIMCKLTYEGD